MKEAFFNFGKSFLNNLKTIILSLVIAVISWFAISFQLFPTITVFIDVPVTAEPSVPMLDRSLELAEPFDETIQVTVQGKRINVGRLRTESFQVFLDFSPVTGPGDYELDVIIKPLVEDTFDITNPTVKRNVKIIQTGERVMQVTANAHNVSAVHGMSIDEDNVAANPARIRIHGEKSLIDSVEQVQIVAISDGEEISINTAFSGELILLDGEGVQISSEGIFIEERAFTVIVPVFKRGTIPLTVDIINVPGNFDRESLEKNKAITPDDIIMASPDDSIDNLENLSLGAVSLSDITLSELRNGLIIEIPIPEDYKNISGDRRARIDFNVDDYGEMIFHVPRTNFNYINSPPGVTVNYLNREIPVRVVGPSEVMRSMTTDDFSGVINFAGMSDITVGERSIGIRFSIAGTDVQAWVIGEYKVDIRIMERLED
jgi:hypothetical protein